MFLAYGYPPQYFQQNRSNVKIERFRGHVPKWNTSWLDIAGNAIVDFLTTLKAKMWWHFIKRNVLILFFLKYQLPMDICHQKEPENM